MTHIKFSQNTAGNYLKGATLAASLFMGMSPAFGWQPEIVNDSITFDISQPNPVINRTEIVRLERRLNKLVEMYADDEEVAPISEKSIANFRALLVAEFNSLLRDWSLFSNDKGALSLEYQKRDHSLSTICISDTQISYYIEKDNNTVVYGVEPFSIDVVQFVLQKVK